MRALEGIRVVEMSVWVAGPATGGILADWGADVIKVEPPGGDPMRQIFARLAGLRATDAPPFDLDNRGKRSVVLDLKRPEARQALERMLERADVFVSNYREKALRALDLDPDAIARRHPRLVVCTISGFGRKGDDRDRPGYDVGAFWARSGHALAITPEGAEVPALAAAMGDHTTALAAAGGVVAALFARERTGRGRLVETSLLRTGIYTLGWPVSIQLHFGKLAPPDSRRAPMNPLVNAYFAGDGRGFWLIGLESDRHWPPTARAAGHPEWTRDPRFADARERRRHSAELVALLDEAFAAHPLEHWARAFDREDVWWAPLQRVSEVVADPQAEAAGAFVEIPSADGSARRSVATPISMSAADTGPTGPVPAPGEHTEAVLRELGYRGAELDSLLTP
jgi:crotonobetainyl-CoA:carnitine CoA-transferase CaiB-like acyl-CoA transferase